MKTYTRGVSSRSLNNFYDYSQANFWQHNDAVDLAAPWCRHPEHVSSDIVLRIIIIVSSFST